MADATAATTPKIEELRGRLKAEPKSRHFYPLAEELRKIHQLEQAEEILREGLQGHPAYLSAWISLGRVLRERGRDHEAVEVLKRALALDAGNVVAAKLLAQAYLGVGDKVEAIKKFKLVYALMPADSEVESEIERLDRELNPANYPAVTAEPQPVVEAPFVLAESDEPAVASVEPLLPDASRFDLTDSHPFTVDEEPFGSTSEAALSSLLDTPGVEAGPLSGLDEAAISEPEAPFVPPPIAAEESAAEPEPFGEIAGTTIGEAPTSTRLDVTRDESETGYEEGGSSTPIPATLTMAQLFESQGHDAQAAELYRQVLELHPDNAEARDALSRGAAHSEPPRSDSSGKGGKIKRLETWRARVTRS
ncbi:MAG: tetratricopeptide repeat protein [Acidobacteria bacterium]|nr:tetratricopeptide repeat protein [Acidobacteriota bacterium]